jgi:mannose-6-phosphate isomerase-like protein (cupin superfamily)
MLIKGKEAVREINKENHQVWDYPISRETGISVQNIKGRVPKVGWAKNKVCNEICFILSGTGTFFIEGKKFCAGKDDVIIIKPGEKSYIKAKNMRMLVITTPDWYPDQCDFLEK